MVQWYQFHKKAFERKQVDYVGTMRELSGGARQRGRYS